MPATCFPAGVNVASAWDVDLAREMGVALARECRAQDVAVVLGPAMNIKRSPLCGRNFEYYSEDPYLAGELAAAFVQGVQSQGVGTSVKHFAANNQEYSRMRVDTLVDERTLREIYLPAFERVVTVAQPWTVMSAYNRLNGVYCSENQWLLDRVLRQEWGFEGLVVSDWGGTNDRAAGVRAGQDLEMPGSGGINDRRLAAAVADGRLDEAALAVVVRVVSLILAAQHSRETAVDAGGGGGGGGDGTATATATATAMAMRRVMLEENHAFALSAVTQARRSRTIAASSRSRRAAPSPSSAPWPSRRATRARAARASPPTASTSRSRRSGRRWRRRAAAAPSRTPRATRQAAASTTTARSTPRSPPRRPPTARSSSSASRRPTRRRASTARTSTCRRR